MGERRIHHELAIATAEVMYALLEEEYQRGESNLNEMMRRLKDLSAYSLAHAEIMYQREGPELLALAMFFGATSNPRYHGNQERLALLSRETITYPGNAEAVEQEVARRKAKKPPLKRGDEKGTSQPRLL